MFRRLHSVSVFRWNLLSWAKPIELVLIARPSSIDWAKLNRFLLETETECSLRKLEF
jgi:hypothetical protein